MKELLSQIIIVVLISAPIMFALATFAVLLKTWGDRQRVRDEKRQTEYDNMYEQIQSIMYCTDANKKLVEQCITVLEGLPYNNRKKTEVLWDQFGRKFNLKTESENAGEVLLDVSAKTGVPVDLIASRWRKRKIADARMIFYRRAKEQGISEQDIAREVNRRDRSTVWTGAKQASTVPSLVEQYEKYYPSNK